jgi:hypothetical protein
MGYAGVLNDNQIYKVITMRRFLTDVMETAAT